MKSKNKKKINKNFYNCRVKKYFTVHVNSTFLLSFEYFPFAQLIVSFDKFDMHFKKKIFFWSNLFHTISPKLIQIPDSKVDNWGCYIMYHNMLFHYYYTLDCDLHQSKFFCASFFCSSSRRRLLTRMKVNERIKFVMSVIMVE